LATENDGISGKDNGVGSGDISDCGDE